jgi:glycosyltransferase involved in cell wall biosynthesis
MDVVNQLAQQKPALAKRIRVIGFTPIEATNVSKLKKDGAKVEIYTNRELDLDINNGDVIVFNTFAISRTTALAAIRAVKQGKASKIFWYGHESSPDGFIDPEIRREYLGLLMADKAKLYAVSEATLREYVKFFGTEKNIEKMTFPFRFPADKFKTRNANDFDELRFITTGSLMDMRKGQYPVLYAFLDFYHNYYKRAPERYRNFRIEFIGAYEKSDLEPQAAYHVKNIKKQFDLSALGLNEHFSMTAGLPHDEAIERIEAANVTICYSLFEALGIFVYEGMATGHPIIRNESAGQEEQLVDGHNGFAVSSKDFAGLVDVIEKMLNKQKTTNEELVAMSKLSTEIAKKATESHYQIIEEIDRAFSNS